LGGLLGGVLEVALEVSWRSIYGLLGVSFRVCPELLGNQFGAFGSLSGRSGILSSMSAPILKL